MRYDTDYINRIEVALRKKRWTRMTLAKRAGVDPATVTRILRGDGVYMKTADKILEALGMHGRDATYSDLPNPRTKFAEKELAKSSKTYPRKRR